MIAADDEVAHALHIQTGDAVVQNKLLYFANEIPAIFTTGYFATCHLMSDDLEHLEFAHVHVWIRQMMNRDLAHSLNEYMPEAITGEAAALFKLPEGTPIIASTQTFYDIQDVPILFNHHHFYPNLYRLKTLQNWDLGQ